MSRSRVFFAVLAAGQSTRIKSERSKLLHEICGKPVLHYPLAVARTLGADRIFLVTGGPHQRAVESRFPGDDITVVHQDEPRGTGHAVMCMEEALGGQDATLVVVPGDAPLLKASTLRSMINFHRDQGALATVLTTRMPDPTGYGRVIRDGNGRFVRIVEHHDASEDILRIDEVCSGVYAFETGALFPGLKKVGSDNKKNEYYLPGVLEIIQRETGRVAVMRTEDWAETLGVNTRADLAGASRAMRERLTGLWMEKGVSFLDPGSVYLETDVEIGRDSVIYPFVALMGKTRIGEKAVILPGAVLRDTTVREGTTVAPGHYEKETL